MNKFAENERLNRIVCEVLDTLLEVVETLVDESEADTLKPVCFTLVTGYITEDYWNVIENEVVDPSEYEMNTLMEATPLEVGLHAFPIFKGTSGEELATGLEKSLLTKALERIKSANYSPKDTIVRENKKTIH